MLDLPSFADESGLLVPVEGGQDIPFAIERVYFIVARSGGPRGFHAHRTLEQLMVCVAGACRVIVDDGSGRSEVLLDRADRGLRIRPMQWHEMHDLSVDCVLVVLASAHYDEADYIRDYDEFRELAQGKAE